MTTPIVDLKGKICTVTAKWSIFYGKDVEVISSAYLIIDGQPQWNCICKDGSGGGILPQNALKSKEDE
jgi:hypothetical protein